MRHSPLLLFIILAALTITLPGCATDNRNLKEEAGLHYKLGNTYLRTGETVFALKELIQAVEKDPRNPDYHHALGIAYYTKGINGEAITHLKTAIKLNPKLSDAHTALGTVFLIEQRLDDAISEFQRAVSNVLYIRPEEAYSKMGWAYFIKEDYKAAIDSLNMALKANPRYSMAYNNLGIVYIKLEDVVRAKKAFQRVIELSPEGDMRRSAKENLERLK